MSRLLNSMESAPTDREILAFHAQGANFHPVKWNETRNSWGMRWSDEYRQHNSDFHGWIEMPTGKPE